MLTCQGVDVIGKMVGKPLGWGTLNNQPDIPIYTFCSGYLLGPMSPFKGLQQQSGLIKQLGAPIPRVFPPFSL